MDRYVAPPKEAHRNKLCGNGEVVVAGGFVVDCKATYQCTRRVLEFLGGKASANNDESEVVVDVKLSAFDLLSVANANPAPIL